MISAEVVEKRMPLNSKLAPHREIAVIPHWMKNPARLSNMCLPLMMNVLVEAFPLHMLSEDERQLRRGCFLDDRLNR